MSLSVHESGIMSMHNIYEWFLTCIAYTWDWMKSIWLIYSSTLIDERGGIS